MAALNSGREYHAPRRVAQATATREAIVDAAGRLFARHGYAATAMAAVAEEAGVAAKSVYGVADKAGLLLLAVERDAAAGGTEDALEALLRRYPLLRAFEEAAAAEPVLREPWRRHERHRRAEVKRLVRAAAEAGRLRPGLTVGRATDTLWALVTWHAVALLVEQRGWSRAKLTAWLEQQVDAVLSGPAAPAPGDGGPRVASITPSGRRETGG
ncbi:TetR family transcriptional regulator [Dactylosporangium sp. CA-092794]|uniref:TetR family transcriptional regulator n=1 Tax=Dactylosporangium sp. CA-092794 TaxID=3239929 RepID=UPI003D92CCC2